MNGMQRKAQRKKRAWTFTEDGLPKDAKDWTYADWADLHRAMEEVRRKVGERHREDAT